ncbi:MAG: calcium/sodium antiporter [Acidiferrobacterales bacterium]|nr:calcium/sodium antiporter [Acidiferrobacterales bacterium]
MSMLIPIAFILVGFFLLIWSADLLVDNASTLAEKLGVSAFVIGVLIIGFGTSAPEMFVSAMAALENKGNLALGNALGSNITNIGLVLGSAALVKEIAVSRNTTLIDIPAVIITGVIAILLIIDGQLSNLDGLILLLILLGYLLWTSRCADISEIKPSSTDQKSKSTLTAFGLTVLSIVILVIASRLLVHGAVAIATILNISELIIGLTIVAIGTSLPELAAAVAAARKGAHQMIIGNIIGSNVFNILGVLGITGVIRATEINVSAITRDFPMMFFFSILMLFFAYTKGKLSRPEGAILLIGYLVYICYLVVTTIK